MNYLLGRTNANSIHFFSHRRRSAGIEIDVFSFVQAAALASLLSPLGLSLVRVI